eukprot:TRINITY_DN38780_c0_g1_i1.p1 TRINITY_DN38780_c0_g1~~TRINITY_DN38780_c0_g1_i1.p1  ORF type:complete len:643 (+),score=187.81 TRINITY_DN38780_c0_g1_i1:96-1931(+)
MGEDQPHMSAHGEGADHGGSGPYDILCTSGMGNWRLEGTICVTSEGGEDDDHFNPLRVPSPARDKESSLGGGPMSAFQRPTNEVFSTVSRYFHLKEGPRKVHNHVLSLTSCLVEDSCPVPELSMFFTYLKALLCKLFAGIVDTETPEEENPLASLLENSVVQDIMGAARVSLREYHQHSKKKKRSVLMTRPSFLRRKTSSPNPCTKGRKLSCYTPRNGRDDKHSLGAAFAGATLPSGNGDKGPKRRPDSRIDRSHSTSMASSLFLPTHSMRNDRTATPPPMDSGAISPRTMMSSLRRRVSAQCGTPALSPSINQSSVSLVCEPPDESITQYFDIIIETACVILTVKYEHQIMELTVDGEDCGVRRSAEWLAARMLDEMYNDGIDPQQALCTQLVLVAEGLALEEGEYVWRHCGSVDQEVMYVVWGEPPEDVLAGRLKIKSVGGDPGDAWYEWGAFAQPGIRTPDGQLFTGPRLNPLLYRYRLATLDVAESLNLTDTRRAPLRAPSFLHTRPGEKMANNTGEEFTGITLSAPPEGSEHKGGTIPRPHIRPPSLNAQIALEEKYIQRYAPDAYCDTEVYELSLEEAIRQQHRGGEYENMSRSEDRSCPCCTIS